AEIDAFVQLLREAHRALCAQAELARSFLLQRRRRERRRRVAAALLALDRRDADFAAGRRFDRGAHVASLLFVGDGELLDFLAVILDQPRRERLLRLLDVGIDSPVLARLEARDLFFALADHAQRRALHAAGGGAGQAGLLPQQRRQIETDQVVERATRLLRVHQVLRNPARLLDRLADGVARDLVEDDAMHVLAVEHI